MESIGIVLKDIMGNSAVFIAGKEAVIVSAVSIVISVFIGPGILHGEHLRSRNVLRLG